MRRIERAGLYFVYVDCGARRLRRVRADAAQRGVRLESRGGR